MDLSFHLDIQVLKDAYRLVSDAAGACSDRIELEQRDEYTQAEEEAMEYADDALRGLREVSARMSVLLNG